MTAAADPERAVPAADVFDAILPGPTIIALLRDVAATTHRIEQLLEKILARDQAKLNTLDQMIRDADTNLINTAGNQASGTTQPEGATP